VRSGGLDDRLVADVERPHRGVAKERQHLGSDADRTEPQPVPLGERARLPKEER
jgi:hypothetical protein